MLIEKQKKYYTELLLFYKKVSKNTKYHRQKKVAYWNILSVIKYKYQEVYKEIR